ncbi:MAG: gliding motility lipoprotein GldD [Bacteroidota bacterium]
MKNLLLFTLLLITITGCSEKFTPKPRGYFRIEFPEKSYHQLNKAFPYNFEVPHYSVIKKDSRNPDEQYWINVTIPENNAEVHISYYNIEKKRTPVMLAEFMDETRSLAYKHSIKADAIEEQVFMNHRERVFGTIYRISGNAASPIQFFLTDSTTHFLRGALYIREVPKIDSIQPVIDFLEPDIIRLIETTTWE